MTAATELAGCGEVLVVTARGSTEPASGSRLLTPIAQDLAVSFPGVVRIRELDYPASFVFFTAEHPVTIDLGDSPAIGVANLVELLNSEAARRPHQRLVLLGWSQGAQVIGDALLPPGGRRTANHAPPLTATVESAIAAVVWFGIPAFTAGEPHNAGTFTPEVSGVHPRRPGCLAAYSSRLRDYCVHDDIAAQHAPGATVDGHVSYFGNALPARALEFIREQLQVP